MGASVGGHRGGGWRARLESSAGISQSPWKESKLVTPRCETIKWSQKPRTYKSNVGRRELEPSIGISQSPRKESKLATTGLK